ncbi:S1C family serine protease [Algihabitans albus]|uniref:S1C family serine protease n=1 Tax=Algihabitans albus TaxID=2164067 RepID=UPI0035CFAEE1
MTLRRLAWFGLLFLVVAVQLSPRSGLADSERTGAEAAANPLDAVVGLRALIPGDARTAATLGTERQGSGVLIDAQQGLVLTIGYLVMEAGSVELLLPDGRIVGAEVTAYDYDSGFGLVRADRPLGLPAMPLGDSSADAEERSEVLVAAFVGNDRLIGPAIVVSRRDFAGYWEYLLPDAIFTTPPHPGFGGAALVSRQGELLGIGSLHVGDAGSSSAGGTLAGNMFVPIQALHPIYDDLLTHGRANTEPRPWLGLHTVEVGGRLLVQRVTPGGPADQAGIEPLDAVLAVSGEDIADQADFYRKIWALGGAGVEVPLTLLRSSGPRQTRVRSIDRYDFLKLDGSF